MAIITRQTHIKRGCLRHHNSAGVTSLFASASGDKTLKLWNPIDDPGKSASDTIGSSVPQTFTLRKLRSFPTKSGLPGLSIIWNPGLHLLTVNSRIAEFGCAKSCRASRPLYRDINRDPWLGPFPRGLPFLLWEFRKRAFLRGLLHESTVRRCKGYLWAPYIISAQRNSTVAGWPMSPPCKEHICSSHGGTVPLINSVPCELSGP